MTAHQAGRLDTAAAGYRRILARQPAHPDALHLLGAVHHQGGDHAEAERLIRRAIAIDAEQPAFHANLAQVCLDRGEPAAAVEACDRVRALAPGRPGLDALHGDALLAAGRAGEAADAYRAALSATPGDAILHNSLGNALAAAGRPLEALEAYDNALAREPAQRHAHLNGIRTAAETDRLEAALARTDAALAALGPDTEAVRWRAELLARLGRPDEALEALQALPAHAADGTTIAALRARLLEQAGHNDRAATTYRTLADASDAGAARARWLVRAGACREAHADAAAAEACYREALAADPDCAPAWQGLVDCDAMTAEDAHAVRERVEADRIGADDRAALHFALGRWHEQHGAYDEAFAEYRRGNDLVAAQRCFDARELARLTDRIIDVFAPERLPLAPRTGAAGPIFIVGMPRSGTTLLEQMLAAHPAVSAGGEREDLRSLATRLPAVAGTEAPFPEGIAELDPTGLRGLADSYRAQVEAAFGSATRFTDKLPGNYLRIGMIRLLFPEARVLHCRRDPLDTCVSCFTTHFARGQSFTYGLDRLATAYREYERLMAYWRRVAPDDFLDVDYETLVAEPEAELRRILAYCDLEWHADCLRFHEGERSIHTASRWQARQPVYGTSVGRWRRFRDHLGPLLELRPGD